MLLRHSFAGVNFIDTYFRSGLYTDPTKPLPFIPGFEGSATVLAVGPDVDPQMVGKRVAFCASREGSYSTFSVASADDLHVIPDGVSDSVAAAVLLQGCTASYLTEDCYQVGPGSVVVVHAAAGGTGLLLTQMCVARGATAVIGICGGAAKAEVSKTVGRATHVVDYTATPQWDEEVRRICHSLGRSGADAVFDGVGKSTFERSCSVLRTRGHMITFGNASGAVEPISPLFLTKSGSISLQRPKLEHFMDRPSGEAKRRVASVFAQVQAKQLDVLIAKQFTLRNAAAAHEYLESKSAIGKILIDCTDCTD